MVCVGDESCSKTEMRSVRNVIVNGLNALNSATIVSQINGLFTLLINSSQTTYSTNIYCNKTDTCNINCQSKYSCTNVYLYCFGKCNITCNYIRPTDCPIVINTTNDHIV